MDWTPRTFLVGCAGLFSIFLLLRGLGGSDNGRHGLPGDHAYSRVIVAVGDLHGDYQNMMKVLEMAGVVDSNGKWSGAADYLVQTGDIVDRGDDTLKMYRYLEDLRTEARQAGGDVLSHFGNHEVMNLIGDWRYVPPSEIKTFGTVSDRQNAITKGFIGQAWRANYSITTRLPLHPSLGPPNTDYIPSRDASFEGLSHAALSFLHGGLSPRYKHLTPYPSAINEIGKSLVRRLQDRKVQPPPHPPNPYPGLPSDTPIEEQELYDGEGPLWYRGWASEKDSSVCKAVDGVLQKTGVRRLVMGHTPNFSGMISRCNGKIILIDTGISRAYGGVLSAARFTYTITSTGDPESWTERDIVQAIYPDKVDTLADDTRQLHRQF